MKTMLARLAVSGPALLLALLGGAGQAGAQERQARDAAQRLVRSDA